LFYETEIKLREALNYPPFTDLVLIGISGFNYKETEKTAGLIYELLKGKINVSKPLLAPISRINNRYRFRIIIKCNFNQEVINILNNMLQEIQKQKIKNTRVIVDVNPNNMT